MRPYFAYASNMIAEDMRRRCPTARFGGIARLRDHRFRISRSGYASVAWEHGAMTHGILWWIGSRDERSLDDYEEIATGLYRRVYRPVETIGNNGRRAALVFIAGDLRLGRPRRDDLERILEAARRHGLPPTAHADIARWLPGARPSAASP